MKRLALSSVKIMFRKDCECGHDNHGEDGLVKDTIFVSVSSILDGGHPVCEECGADLELLDDESIGYIC